jgi:hypothetical protein
MQFRYDDAGDSAMTDPHARTTRPITLDRELVYELLELLRELSDPWTVDPEARREQALRLRQGIEAVLVDEPTL